MRENGFIEPIYERGVGTQARTLEFDSDAGQKGGEKGKRDNPRFRRERARSRRTQHSTSSAAEDFRKYQFKLISAATNLLSEYAHDAVQAHSITDLIVLTTSHSRRQFEMMADQTELAASAQRMATESTRPLTSVFGGQARPMS